MQTESISEQTLGESVDKYAEESVSANFVCEEETEVSSNTSQVTDMSGMFYCCTNLSSVDIKGFDTTKVTTMKSMFASCKNLSDIGIDGTGK